MKPTPRAWALHGALLAVTLLTATIAGVLWPFGHIPLLPELVDGTAPDGWEVFLHLPSYYWNLLNTVFLQLGNPAVLAEGLAFSLSLMFILASHEAGHYVACRIYKVDATLPFFIPTPPMIGPAGTFGAFIRIVSPMPSRKAVFDIGVAGPIAGFIALLPISVLALLTMESVSPAQAAAFRSELYFADPLYMQLAALLLGVNLELVVPNGFYYATWMGLLVTALNLIPSGQLDGGHVNYAVFGTRVHKWTGRIAFIAMSSLALLGYYLYESPSGFLIAVLLGVMLRVGHPRPSDTSPLDGKRIAIAFVTLVIFILCFVPFPIQIRLN